MNQDDYDSLSKLAEQQKAIEKRDWFAGMALQGLHANLSPNANWPIDESITTMAEIAYKQADAMMKAREQ